MTSLTSRTVAIPNISIRVEAPQTSGAPDRMIVTGTLDADGAPVVNAAFRKRIAEGRFDLDVDLQGVPMISSAGVGSLIAGIGELRDEGGQAGISAMSGEVRHVLELLDLVEFLTESSGTA